MILIKHALLCLGIPSVLGFVPPSNKAVFRKMNKLHTSSSDELDFKIPYSEDDVRFPSFQVAFNQRWRADNVRAVYLLHNAEEAAKALDDALKNYEDGVKIRSGGHCYEDFVLNNGTKAILDVGSMLDWGHDKEKGYYLSAGDTNWEAFKKIFRKWGVVLPGGSCYSVGLGGHISGGGDGILSRLYGTTVDWLTGIEIVVKDKKDECAYVKYVSEDSTEKDDYDLYWACRGAGNGNFGIITKYYFKKLPKSPKGAIITSVAFRWEHMTAARLKLVLDRYVEFASQDDNRASSGKFQIMHSAAGESQMTIHTAYFNDTDKNEAKAFHHNLEVELGTLCPVSPCSTSLAGHAGYWYRPARPKNTGEEDAVKDSTTDFPFYEATQTMNPSGPNQRGKYKSAYMKTKFPQEQIDTMIKYLTKIPEGLKEDEHDEMKQSLLQIDCFGGRINDVLPHATALAQRSYVVKLQFQTYWVDPSKDEIHKGWIREFYKEMYKEYGGTPDPRKSDMFEGCYYNYPDVDLNEGGLDNALYLYFQDNYENNPVRNLVGVKRRWDPNNYFNHKQSIPVKPELK